MKTQNDFTLDRIQAAHAKVKSGVDFPKYVQELKALGMSHYDLFVADGHAVYYSITGQALASEAKYPAMEVANTGSASLLQQALTIHQQGQTDYPAFCQQAAAAGVEKWTTHVQQMEVIYFDKQGSMLVSEPIPAV